VKPHQPIQNSKIIYAIIQSLQLDTMKWSLKRLNGIKIGDIEIPKKTFNEELGMRLVQDSQFL
jgi:hypothetical protein